MIKVYKDNRPAEIPKDITGMYDLGFYGIEGDYPEQRSSLPIKRKKNQILTKEQEEYNGNHSAKRIVVEHVFARLKKYIHENHLVSWLPLVSCLAYNIYAFCSINIF